MSGNNLAKDLDLRKEVRQSFVEDSHQDTDEVKMLPHLGRGKLKS